MTTLGREAVAAESGESPATKLSASHVSRKGGYSGHRGDAACGVGADLGERESGIDGGVGEQCGDAGGCGALSGGEVRGRER